MTSDNHNAAFGYRGGSCPNCGAPIEFGLASSGGQVCSHCRHSILRDGAGVRDLGLVADLVPTAPRFGVGEVGRVAGRAARIAGRLQLDHGRGPWDEWYVGFEDGGWGWLAAAQGHIYLTLPVVEGGLPTFEQLAPGQRLQLPGVESVEWSVQERVQSTLVSAEGELPFAVEPGERGRSVDLVGPGGAFATVDYGDGRAPPRLFAGRQLADSDVVLAPGAGAPDREDRGEAVALKNLVCGNCTAPLPLRASSTERVVCAYCDTPTDVDTEQTVRAEPPRRRATPRVPLGRTGTLDGESVMVIGFMIRSTVVENEVFAWREYLLHREGGGYSWLVEDNGHWVVARDVSAADVDHSGRAVRHAGRQYKQFSAIVATVDYVIGEFYWRVEVGERSGLADYIAPPYVVSEERTSDEVLWSAGRYLAPADVERAFALEEKLPKPRGVAPAQPNPVAIASYMTIGGTLAAALLAIAVLFRMGAHHRVLVDTPVALPGSVVEHITPAGADRAIYTEPFTVTHGPTTLELDLTTTANNDYVGLACALIEEDTGEIIEFYVSAESYHGYTAGESWSEGSPNSTAYVDRVPAGRYVLRIEGEWNHWRPLGPTGVSSFPPTTRLVVHQGRRSWANLVCSFVMLLLPLVLVLGLWHNHEKRRWYESNLGTS